MKVYLVILEDRHTDVEVEVYATAAAALRRTIKIMEQYDYTPDEPDEEIPGWMFHARLSRAGDRVRVEETEVRS